MHAAVLVGSVAVPGAVVAILLAFTLDVSFGEPPGRIHPVALFGRLIVVVDREWARPRAVGLVVALTLPVIFAVTLAGVTVLALTAGPVVGSLVAGCCLFVTMSYRLLLVTGRDVVTQTASDPEAARSEIRALVGRDTADLSPAHLRSGAVESLAENLADGLVAPLCGFLAGALVSPPAAVAGAAWVKGVNTLDSMLGYESRPVGWASARLDDAVMWLPARVSALLLALAARRPGAVVGARSDAGEPSSPNSGWPMATLARTAGVELHKPGAYRLNAQESLPGPERATEAIRQVALAGALSCLVAVTLAWLAAFVHGGVR
jgi:adenosylcobinamide-phosphate synthase